MNAIREEMTYSEMAEQERLRAAGESLEAQALELYAQAYDVEADVEPHCAERAGAERRAAATCRQNAARHFANYQTYLAKAEKETQTAQEGTQ